MFLASYKIKQEKDHSYMYTNTFSKTKHPSYTCNCMSKWNVAMATVAQFILVQ